MMTPADNGRKPLRFSALDMTQSAGMINERILLAEDYLGKPCSPRHLVARIRDQAPKTQHTDRLCLDDMGLSKRARESSPSPRSV